MLLPKLLLLSLVVVLPLQTATNPKQELNDQLFEAVRKGDVAAVTAALDHGADVKVKDTFYGATAMTWALDNKHVDVVKLLLQKDSGDVDDVLMTGVREGVPEVVKVAIDNGGATAPTLTAALAMSSSDEKNAPITEMLKKAGAKPPLEGDAATLQ